MEELAVFGGTPVRTEKIHYGRQWIDTDDTKAVTATLLSDYLTGGPKINELEERLCGITGAEYAVAVSNGTAALHIACLALGIKPGDEVIVSAMTFAASANCVLYCGATPVFADIRRDTYNIDIEDVKRKITPRTKAIVAVDFTGQAVELDELLAICREHNLYLIEDGAHSLGTIYKGRPVGSIADITTFSFHPVKTVTSGEGGACMTNNEELYKRMKLLRSHGITRDEEEMVNKTDDPWYNEQVMLGFNYRMTDFQAALLLSQLNKLEKFSEMRKAVRARYNEAFRDVPGLILQECIRESDTTWHLYILRLDPEVITCTRREFFDALDAEGIAAQVHYLPVYRHSYYESLGYKKGLCPVAEDIYEHILSIPFYPALSDKEINDTIKAVKKVAAYYTKAHEQGVPFSKDYRLNGERIYLRPITEADTETVLSWRNSDVVKSNYFYRSEITKEDHLKWLHDKVDKGLVYQFVAVSKDGDEPVGCIYLQNYNSDENSMEVGIFMNPAAISSGFGFEAYSLVNHEIALKLLGLDSVSAKVISTNEASLKLHEKTGFTRAYVDKCNTVPDNIPVETVHMVLKR